MNKKKVFYGRCSTARQEMSAELQLDAVEKKYGPMTEVYFDKGVSGNASLEKKIQLVACLDSLDKNTTLCVYSFSRIARETLQALWIEKEIGLRGAELVSVQEEDACGSSPEKILLRTILQAISSYERNLITARIKAAKETGKKNSKYLGGRRPYGFIKVGDEMVVEPKESKVISQMMEWRKDGKTYQGITNLLNVSGVPSATGGNWHYRVVYKILNDGRYDNAVAL